MMPRAELVGMFLAVLVASVIVLLVILGVWQLAELLVARSNG